ncbi:TPA: ATP-binding protein [Yersinia enterocolitica]|uniref:phosphoribosyltransferase-like protein n=1 Tax=Yersinia enterocolitica TaxID=630 RepID=UPI0005DDF488|nr:ATP-binding protein [Yersinia enterocolitica]CQJ65041.1 Predicted ATPase (AAA+ superfamily) [Yersinia enterocolitica]
MIDDVIKDEKYNDSGSGITESAILITRLEREIELLAEGENSSAACEPARDALVEVIKSLCSISGSYTGANFERVLGKVELATQGHNAVAVILVRCLSIDGLIPIDDLQNIMVRKLMPLFENYIPNIMKIFKIDKQQNYEKINIIRTIHSAICNNYNPLAQLPSNLKEILNHKETILKCLKHKIYQSYLEVFNFIPIRSKIEALIEAIDSHLSSEGADYKTSLEELEKIINELSVLLDVSRSFFTIKYAEPLFCKIKKEVDGIRNNASEMSGAVIELQRQPPKSAEKKYPLHQKDKELKIIIPFINKGPSTALDVNIEIVCGDEENILLANEQIRCGDVRPGDFAVCLEAHIIESAKKLEFTLEVNWKEIFGSQNSQIYDICIEGQNEKVDWAELEKLEPYSLEVAEGEMFVGREAKVKNIVNKLLKTPMTSTYVTGQKRIGKTSLAKAVVNNLKMESDDFHSLYLEYGEYCSTSPQKTLKTLGENIFSFLIEYLPGSYQSSPDFSESLADLNLIAKSLEAKSPNKRFIIILDEFDEIHPEMYRSGPLAETFFANLRTLAARKNLAFILVGGEKMPFIIGAQGDQLNKFSRETLDYFSRSTEWGEYIDLIRNPVEGKLNWDDAAINAIFNLTHGHPYYTKLMCSKIVSAAVKERDTEIIDSDVSKDMILLMSELDTNAFAHLWKDGINYERDKSEVIELKRLRVLVCMGRCLRENNRTKEDIEKSIDGSQLLNQEIAPIISDFQRREILNEKNKELYFTVPLFENWLKEYGVNKLITSTLGDELEAGIKRAEDEAHVTSFEIQELVEKWPLYRSQKVDGERIRAWLEQVPDILSQRLMFKLLSNLRFIRPLEIESFLKDAHAKIIRDTIGITTMIKRTDRRSDILITSCDGIGKSGTQYARMYAKNNSISTNCIIDSNSLIRKVSSLTSETPIPKAVVLVDDVVGSGETLSEGISYLLSSIGNDLQKFKIPLLVIAIIGTEEGEGKVNDILKAHSEINKIYVAEMLENANVAFPKSGYGFWEDMGEMHRAKALCLTLGTRIYKKPLGFKEQGLLLVLPETCPNNSLPILFQSKAGKEPWKPLFERPTS